ncbi:Ig-like domain-containing protein [Pseudoalteromonas sp. Cn5-37]|nr:Ig-like domain-containing protein [Pseudoalteromonas sp. Cn5-37]MCF2916823.1 Ig-like domain-containing protein [Pseudoalteromonas sp. Cn5-37]
MTATIVDAAGNVGTDTGSGSIDTLPPSLAIDSLGTINDDTPTISGTSNEPAGSVVNLSVSDGTNTYTFTATVLGDGTWSADVPSPLNNGSISIDASITDAAGNETTANDTAVLDTTAPSITINVIGETNDTTPTINGTSDAVNGSVVTVVIDDGINPAETLTTTVNGGTWTVTASSALAEGDFTVTATVTENGIDGTATRTGIIDTTMPAIDINALDVTNDTTPTVSGTASAPQGSTVTVVFTDANNNSHTVTTVMQSNGTWSVAASTLLAEGEYTVTATVSDQAGNPATASATGEIDITAPTISLDTLADSNDVTPLISGQTTGAAVGSLVLLTITDSAGNVQSATATVQADGSWSVEPSTALAEGDYTVVATVSDAAGNEGSDTETGTIDVTAPTISIDAPALTNDNTPTVTGTSDLANTSLAVTFTDADGISHSVTVTTDASGNWSAEAGQALADGNYTVSASISDAAGNNSSASDSGEVDTIAPDIRVIPSFLLGNLVGLSGTSDLPEGSVITITEHLVGGLIGLTYTAITDANGDWTLANITVPLLNLAYVTASGTDAAGNTATVSTLDFDNVAPELTVSVATLTNDTTPTISGTTDMGQGTVINVTVQDANGDSQSFTATVQSDQTWSVDVPAELADGTFTVTASVRDQVGNLTTEQTTGVLDSIAPTLSVNAIGGIAEARPTITGSSNEIGGSVVVEIAGQTLTTTVDTDGTWQLVVPVDIVDGSYTITASITDDANNTQTATASITVDTVTPVVLLDVLGIGNSSLPVISGTSTESPGTQVSVTITDSNSDTQTLTATVLGDGTWQVTPAALPDGNYTVTASITDVAGNIGSDTESGSIDTLAPSLTINSLGTTNDSTPIISGTSNEPAGSIVSLSVSNGGNIYSLSATVQIDGTWSVDVVTPLDDGSVTITASITDAANNTTTATDNATLDTNAPTVSIGTLAITNDTTPIISGTSDAVDGTQVTINVEDALGNTQTITTTVTGGIWSVELATVLSEGQYTVDASVTENGLTGTASKVGEIDLTAPSILVNAPAITNDTTPTISGTSDAPQGTVVTLVVSDSLGNDVTASAIVNASGNWSVALPSSIAEGAYTVEASISDAAGNSATTSVSGIIDITAPDVVIDTIAVATDLTPLASGSATGAVAGNRVVVTFVDAAGVSHSVETTLDSSLNWQVEATQALAEGQYTVTAVVTDTAGNDGSVSTTSAVDTTAPIVSIDQSSLILTNDSTPVISGTSDAANSTVVIVFTAAGGLQHTVTTTTDASGNWQVEAGQALADGVYSVTASITDTAGNTGTDSKTGGEVDTVAPELSITPSFLLGNLVSLSGTSDLPEGSVITITNYLIGGGIGVPYTATVDANGDWQVLNLSVSLLTLAYVEASATDAAGNTTTISSIDYSNDPSLDAFDVTNYNPGILGLLLPFAEGTAEPGTEVYAIGSNLIGLNLLNIIDASVLSSSPSTTTDSDGDWSIGLSFLDLGNEYYFAIVDTETGEYIVKNTSNDLVGTGVIESEPDSGIISLGAEPVLAGLDNSEEPPENESSTSGAEQLGESIDLSVILAKADTEPTLHSNSAPLEVTIDDVLSDSEQSEVLALNIDSEQQSLAFDPNDSISSQPASDIQSESEDMIKKLIEDGNKSVDI